MTAAFSINAKMPINRISGESTPCAARMNARTSRLVVLSMLARIRTRGNPGCVCPMVRAFTSVFMVTITTFNWTVLCANVQNPASPKNGNSMAVANVLKDVSQIGIPMEAVNAVNRVLIIVMPRANVLQIASMAIRSKADVSAPNLAITCASRTVRAKSARHVSVAAMRMISVCAIFRSVLLRAINTAIAVPSDVKTAVRWSMGLHSVFVPRCAKSKLNSRMVQKRDVMKTGHVSRTRFAAQITIGTAVVCAPVFVVKAV